MSRRKVFLVGGMAHEITSGKLPSKLNCLSVLFYNNMRFVKLHFNASAAVVIDECLVFWKKARVPPSKQFKLRKRAQKVTCNLATIIQEQEEKQ